MDCRGEQMERFEMTLEFPDVESCGEFYKNASKENLEHEDFSIALPDSGFNFDNHLISLVFTFFQSHGPQTLTAVAVLLKTILDKIKPPKDPKRAVRIKTKWGRFEIYMNMSAHEIREVLNASVFRKQ
jgi:hypothetical protein